MHLRTLCGTRPKQYPLNLKLPCFLAGQWPRNRLSITSGLLHIGAIRRTLAFFYVSLLSSFFAAFPGFLLGAADYPCRQPQCVPLLRTSSSTCFYPCQGIGRSDAQNLGTGSIYWLPSSYEPCRRPTQSWCGSLWAASGHAIPPIDEGLSSTSERLPRHGDHQLRCIPLEEEAPKWFVNFRNFKCLRSPPRAVRVLCRYFKTQLQLSSIAI